MIYILFIRIIYETSHIYRSHAYIYRIIIFLISIIEDEIITFIFPFINVKNILL